MRGAAAAPATPPAAGGRAASRPGTLDPDGALSPLEAVEQAVQARAKAERLDPAAPGGRERLRALIAEEVSRWNAEHERGRRSFAIADPAAVADRAFRNLAGYGPLEPLLADPDVWEVMINAPDAVFVRRHAGASGYHDEVFHDDEHVLRTLTKLLDDAAGAHRTLDSTEGLQDARLDDGARLHIVHGDLARGGHLVVNIRRFSGVPFRSLDELVDRGTLTAHAAGFLRACVQARASIVFAGAPGSGKTTLLTCCAAELDPSLRVVVAEEVFETDIPLPNVAHLQTRAGRSDRPAVDLRRLVSGFLRMAPDVAIVGEVRDREALPLLLTLSSGVKGYTTIHAGSARAALSRLRFVAQLAEGASHLPFSALNTLVAESIDLVVYSARTPGGVRVEEIAAVEELTGGAEATSFTVTELFTRPEPGAPLTWTGHLPVRLGRTLRAAGFDIRALADPASAGLAGARGRVAAVPPPSRPDGARSHPAAHHRHPEATTWPGGHGDPAGSRDRPAETAPASPGRYATTTAHRSAAPSVRRSLLAELPFAAEADR